MTRDVAEGVSETVQPVDCVDSDNCQTDMRKNEALPSKLARIAEQAERIELQTARVNALRKRTNEDNGNASSAL